MQRNCCLIVQHSYPKDVRVRKEAMALIAKGYKVSVIALHEPGYKKSEVVDKVQIHRVSFPKKRAGKLRYLFEYMSFFILAGIKLNKIDFRERFDVIHVNTLPDFLVFSALIQKYKGRKIVLDMHEIMPEFFMAKFHIGYYHPIVGILRFIEKMSLRFADEVITVTEPIKRIFNKRAVPDNQITVVMNTMDIDKAKRFEKPTDDKFNCVYHGTITKLYGLDFEIKGFAKALSWCPSMYFNIFGSGSQLDALKSLVDALDIGDYVIFYGEIGHEEMISALRKMNLGILALPKNVFTDLSFSNKLAEYVCLNIPVLHSNLNSTQFYFSDKEILFFNAGSINDFSMKLKYAYENRDILQGMASSAYKRYEKEYNWKIMAQRYLNVVETGH